MITYLIIDDEPIAHRIIEGYAAELDQLKKIGNCYNAFEAIKLLQQQSVDVLFLDINMPKLNGFELLRTLAYRPKVIVTSAYKEFALEGYEFSVSDYLLKPFSFERFLSAINKIAVPEKVIQQKVNDPTKNQYLFIKGDKKYHHIFLDDLYYVEAYGNYCKVILENETLITLQKISVFQEQLPKDFVRVHKSFIISKTKIHTVQGNTIEIKNTRIPVGQTYKGDLKKLLGI